MIARITDFEVKDLPVSALPHPAHSNSTYSKLRGMQQTCVGRDRLLGMCMSAMNGMSKFAKRLKLKDLF